jgi:Flp pilus assembly protein TadD
MRWHVDSTGSGLAVLSLAGFVLAGCVTQSTRETTNADRPPATVEQPERTSRSEPSRREQADRAANADASVTAEDAAADDAITAVLAERRRGDYPEIELNPTGFTITEQVRIDGDARLEYERALTLLRQERYAEGIAILVAVIEMAPEVTAPYVDLGIAYERSGDAERARETLEKAALLSPDHPIVQNELGILYRRNGQFADARASYEKALTVFPDFHYARRNLAVLCDLYLADLECALQHYTSYLDSVGEDSEVEIWIADIRNRLSL